MWSLTKIQCDLLHSFDVVFSTFMMQPSPQFLMQSSPQLQCGPLTYWCPSLAGSGSGGWRRQPPHPSCHPAPPAFRPGTQALRSSLASPPAAGASGGERWFCGQGAGETGSGTLLQTLCLTSARSAPGVLCHCRICTRTDTECVSNLLACLVESNETNCTRAWTDLYWAWLCVLMIDWWSNWINLSSELKRTKEWMNEWTKSGLRLRDK